MSDEQVKPEVDEENNEAQEKFEKLQADYNSKLEELKKYQTESINYKKRAEKAEKLAKGKVEPEELDDWKQKFEIVNEKNAMYEGELAAMRGLQKSNQINQVVLTRANEYSAGTSGMLPILIDAQTRLENGVISVVENVNGKQQIRLNKKTLQPMTLDELRDEILEKTPSLLKAKTEGGTGSTGNNSSGNGGMITLAELEALPMEEQKRIMGTLTKEQTRQLLKSAS